MDEFGVLTERFGIKPQGKAAPMAASKRSTASTTNGVTRNFDSNSGPDAKSSSYNSNTGNGSFISDNDFLFLSNANSKKSQNYSGFDDVFSQLQNSTASNTNNGDYDDVFGLNNKSDDVFGSFSSPPKQSGVVGDLLGGFDGEELKSKSSKQKLDGFDDLIPGFGGSSSSTNRTNAGATKSTFMSAEDPFVVLERTSSPLYGSSDPFSDPLDELGKLTQRGGAKTDVPSEVSSKLRPPPKSNQVLKSDKVKSSPVSSIDELEDFAMGRVHNGAGGRSNLRQTKETRGQHSAKASKYKEAEDASTKTQQRGEDDIESFFSVGARSSSVPRSRATTVDPIFDAKVNNSGSNVAQRKPSVGASNTKKVSSVPNTVDDLSAIFGASPGFGAFEEYEGESEERRRARLERHQRTQYRMNKALADMNHRDYQAQQEQEEKRRIADALDFEIKNWAAGKEGNMRALLSSLQNVLWPECGWEPVSLTDLITSSSVKKVYKKATLCVHPDKVQQKGATIQQKYTAEKVFDILKEAWNKFNKEELS